MCEYYLTSHITASHKPCQVLLNASVSSAFSLLPLNLRIVTFKQPHRVKHTIYSPNDTQMWFWPDPCVSASVRFCQRVSARLSPENARSCRGRVASNAPGSRGRAGLSVSLQRRLQWQLTRTGTNSSHRSDTDRLASKHLNTHIYNTKRLENILWDKDGNLSQ